LLHDRFVPRYSTQFLAIPPTLRIQRPSVEDHGDSVTKILWDSLGFKFFFYVEGRRGGGERKDG